MSCIKNLFNCQVSKLKSKHSISSNNSHENEAVLNIVPTILNKHVLFSPTTANPTTLPNGTRNNSTGHFQHVTNNQNYNKNTVHPDSSRCKSAPISDKNVVNSNLLDQNRMSQTQKGHISDQNKIDSVLDNAALCSKILENIPKATSNSLIITNKISTTKYRAG